MAQKYKAPDINERTLVCNPFIGSLVIPVTHNIDKDRYAGDEKSGYFNKKYYRETESHVRVYVSSKRRLVLNALSPNSSKLLHWCVQELDVKKDWFWLNKQRYMDETGVAYNTYKKSIKELQDAGLILKTSYNDVFWINPHYFFRGNRVDFYGEYDGVINITRDYTKNVDQND